MPPSATHLPLPLRASAALALLLTACAHRPAEPPLRIVSPEPGATVPLLNATQRAFLEMPRDARVAAFADESFRRELAERGGDKPAEVPLRWETGGTNGAAGAFTVEVRRLPDGTPVFHADTEERGIALDNLEIAREYEWTVHANGPGQASATATFRTEDRAPRLLRAGAVPNVRDFGGRIGLGGRRVRQGLVFRSAGLNENARDVFWSREKHLELEGPAYLEREAAFSNEVARLRALCDRPDGLRLLAGDALAGDWTLFRPELDAFDREGDAALRALRDVPQAFLGAPAESVRRDAAGACSFGEGDRRNAVGPAVFLLAADFPEDGWVPLSCGADWCWTLRVNGEIVFDRDDGNERHPVSADNFAFAVPVRKGRNLFAASVRAGNAGWSWCCRPAPDKPAAKLLATLAENAERRLRAFPRSRRGRRPGASRITDANRSFWLDTLGVRTDLDLRRPDECHGMRGSPLGPSVRWVHVSSGQYAGIQEPFGREAFAKVFRVFLDPDSYPIVFHCISGQDRTGAVAFILNALLGVDEEELWRDWEASAFHNPNPAFNHEKKFNLLYHGFDRWPGATVNERVEAYVLDLGFTPEDVDAFRGLLLEPASPPPAP